jgi:hypothetical protein
MRRIVCVAPARIWQRGACNATIDFTDTGH